MDVRPRLAGHSLARITRALNDAGIPCPSAADPGRNTHRAGQAWTLGTVRAILANPRYTGRQVWNRQPTSHELIDPANTGLGHRQVQRWALPDGWIISARPSHPALVSEEDFIAVQGIRAERDTAACESLRPGDALLCPETGIHIQISCPRGDLNTETGEISPDRGNHAIKATERGERARVFRDVFAIWSATWPVHGRAAGAEHLLPRRCAASVTTRVDQLPQPTGSKTSWPTATSRASPPSSATRPTPSRPPIAGNGGNCPYSPVRVITSDGLIGAATTSTSACPALSRGVSNSAG